MGSSLYKLLILMVGAEGFEPPTLCSQSRCATRLRYAPTFCIDCIANRIGGCARRRRGLRTGGSPCAEAALQASFDATIESEHGGYSSAAERLTVAQDVVGSIPTSRPKNNSL